MRKRGEDGLETKAGIYISKRRRYLFEYAIELEGWVHIAG